MGDKVVTYIITMTRQEILSKDTGERMTAKADKLLKLDVKACEECKTEAYKLFVELADDAKVMCKSCYFKPIEVKCE